MLTGRAVAAADRLVALDERLHQLEHRLERIGAGERSSAEDVRDARTHASSQQGYALEAEAVLDRLLRHQERFGLVVAPEPPPDRSQLTIAPTREPRQPPAQIGESRPRQYWRAVTDQARRLDWRSWSEALCVSAAGALPTVLGVGISVFADRLPCPMASTDARTGRLEEAQQVFGEGPAVAAQSSGAPVVASVDDSTDAIWLAWSRSARRSGVNSVWCFPHYWPDIGSATVTFYRGTGSTVSSERDEASVLSALAGRALKTDLDRNNLSALDALHSLHVATGILAERHGTTVEDALARLRAHAFAADRPLNEVAAAVIDEDLRLD
jgi:hypothetical protein